MTEEVNEMLKTIKRQRCVIKVIEKVCRAIMGKEPYEELIYCKKHKQYFSVYQRVCPDCEREEEEARDERFREMQRQQKKLEQSVPSAGN